MFGLLTELLAEPGKRGDRGYRGWANDPECTSKIWELLQLERSKKVQVRNVNLVPNSDDCTITSDELKCLSNYWYKYRKAWAMRLFPHIIGIFPYVACWVVLINHFFESLNDLKVENEDLWKRIPDFVVPAVGGTVLIFTSFTFVQYAATQIEHKHTDS